MTSILMWMAAEIVARLWRSHDQDDEAMLRTAGHGVLSRRLADDFGLLVFIAFDAQTQAALEFNSRHILRANHRRSIVARQTQGKANMARFAHCDFLKTTAIAAGAVAFHFVPAHAAKYVQPLFFFDDHGAAEISFRRRRRKLSIELTTRFAPGDFCPVDSRPDVPTTQRGPGSSSQRPKFPAKVSIMD